MPNSVLIPGNSALVTGASLGIGRATAQQLAGLGMNVCLVDLPSADLEQSTAEAAKNAAGKIVSVSADVALEGDWESIRQTVESEFGSLQFLMNNAVTRSGRGFDAPLAEWRRALEVNFWGVVMGVQTLLPMMLEDGRRGRIVNVGSKQGITNPPGHPIYNIAKSAVKTYSEQLQHELRNRQNPNVSVHLLVPGWTTTGKNEHKKGAWLPHQVVDFMIEHIEADDFYVICPDDEVSQDRDRRRILWGAQDITENRPPLSRWHADFKDEAAKVC